MLLHTALLLSAFALQTGTPRVHVWKAADVAAKGKALSQKLSEQKVASEVLAAEGNRAFQVAHREGSGVAEWHETQADVFFIVSGEATLVYGGSMVDAKRSGAGEMRGPSIRDGVEVKLGPGDVVHIPARTPHQMKLDSGRQITYFVVKITE